MPDIREEDDGRQAPAPPGASGVEDVGEDGVSLDLPLSEESDVSPADPMVSWTILTPALYLPILCSS